MNKKKHLWHVARRLQYINRIYARFELSKDYALRCVPTKVLVNNCTPVSDCLIPALADPPELFWIGGTLHIGTHQKWSNPANSSISSGGPANPQGCVPGLATAAVFDNSGLPRGTTIVEVDICNAKSTTWGGK